MRNAIQWIEIAQKCDGKGSAIDRATASNDERGCPLPKFFREIVCHLVHVHTNAENGEVRRFWLRSHFYQHSCDLAVLDVNVVRWLHRSGEMDFALDCRCHYLCCSLCQLHRVANRGFWSEQH